MFEKRPWECYPNIWKNSTAFFTYLRGALRKAWVNNPVKLEYIKSKRKQISNPNLKGNKKTVWGFTCDCCGKDYPIKECQVDHKIPAGSLNQLEDIQGFVQRLLCVTDNDLQLVCKGCHSIITYSQRMGLSLTEAALKKKVITFTKLSSGEQKDTLKRCGISDIGRLRTKKDMIRKYEEVLKDEIT